MPYRHNVLMGISDHFDISGSRGLGIFYCHKAQKNGCYDSTWKMHDSSCHTTINHYH